MISSVLAWWHNPENAYALLALTAFLSATILPLGSEPLFLATLANNPDDYGLLLMLATLANSAGSMANYGLGRGGKSCWQGWQRKRHVAENPPTPPTQKQASSQHSSSEYRAQRWLSRFGAAACVLAWLPIVGDALPIAAGVLRLSWQACAFWVLVGKGGRYFALSLLVIN
jgi:membrane protein YqaA with SNARE-associated domain